MEGVDQNETTIFANTSSLALNFRGLGLPAPMFLQFNNLLGVITHGEAECLPRKSGYCMLTSPCEYYKDMGVWDYDFKVKFTSDTDENYIRVPLATFAANYEIENNVCVIFVEYLDERANDSK